MQDANHTATTADTPAALTATHPDAATSTKCTTKKILEHVLRSGSNSIGDFERLAGIDTCNPAERQALWDQFRNLYALPDSAALSAVMAECRRIAARRVNNGELSLWLPAMAQGGAA